MDGERWCTVCRADLAGPFQPPMPLAQPAGDEGSEELTISAQAWICLGCGLVHWYVEDADVVKLPEPLAEEEGMAIRPASSSERRSQILRMLRKVRRL